MNEQDIINEFKAAGAMLEGHFILSSGLHSAIYLQCARVLMDASRGERLCKALAGKITAAGHRFDAIVAPAMGGVVVGYEMGRQLNIPTMFCERVEGKFELRRGFSLAPGAKILVVEDVVTTGKSSMEAVACIETAGGGALAVASLIDRRGSNDVSLTLPLISLLKLDVPAYKPDALPAHLKDIPAVKPGQPVLERESILMRPAVIITGGAKRVGAALARYFAEHGYDVALTYNQSQKEAEALQKEIAGQGTLCEIFKADMNDSAAFLPLLAEIKKRLPGVVALINNASVFERARFMETDEALFDRQLAVNFKAPFFLTQAFAKIFQKGVVVNILDTDIVTTQGSHFAYLVSKKALAEFTLMAARDLGPEIRVNAVCPGHMLPSSQVDEDYGERLKQILPLKKHPTLSQLSEAVAWLISAETITGQLIFVDGGKNIM